jgi:hypothetical protein
VYTRIHKCVCIREITHVYIYIRCGRSTRGIDVHARLHFPQGNHGRFRLIKCIRTSINSGSGLLHSASIGANTTVRPRAHHTAFSLKAKCLQCIVMNTYRSYCDDIGAMQKQYILFMFFINPTEHVRSSRSGEYRFWSLEITRKRSLTPTMYDNNRRGTMMSLYPSPNHLCPWCSRWFAARLGFFHVLTFCKRTP